MRGREKDELEYSYCIQKRLNMQLSSENSSILKPLFSEEQ